MCQKDSAATVVDVQTRILARNDNAAAHNREHFLDRGIFSVNVMGSPGSGKTAVLEATARTFGDANRLAALAGDLATDNDAARLLRAGLRSRAIETGQACHLDAEMVHHELHHFDLTGVDYFFIENVGNLVCPSRYDLGEEAKIVLLSVAEGEEKPLKYPSIFFKSKLILLTKIDLLPYVPFDYALACANARSVNAEADILGVSCQTDTGLRAWMEWLSARMRLAANVIRGDTR